MKKKGETIGGVLCGVLWGMIASSVISFLLTIAAATSTAATSGPKPANRTVDLMIFGYIASCFAAGLIVQKLKGSGFGIGFSIALGATFYFTLWRGEVAWFASLVATIAAFAGNAAGAISRFAATRLRRKLHERQQLAALKAAAARRRGQSILSPRRP